MQDVLRLGEDEVAEAAEVVVRAFERDPFFRHCFPGSDRRYARQLGAGFRMLFGAKLQRGEPLFGIRLQDTLIGAVALEKPGRPMGWGDFVRSPLLFRQLVGFGLAAGPRAVARLDRWDRGVRTLRPPEPHFYVLGLGVLPEFQGKGYGRVLMERLHQEADAHAEAVGVGLDTDTDENVSFYRHLGYEVTGTVDIGGFDMYCMFRPTSR
jgi:ribosomal protein S18 acetylase RimI-like enzyme